MARSPFYVDGQSYPSQTLRPNYEADQYVDCYRTLTCFRKDINVKRNDYIKGYCLYALKIDPYYSFNVKRQGHCRLEMKIAKPLPESATLILYATFLEILNIDSSRSVSVRYMRGPSPKKVLLRRSRRQLYILSDRTLGYQRKVEALGGKQKFIRTLLKITLAHLKPAQKT